MSHCVGSLYFNCNFPRWMAYANISYMVSFLVLFSNFYIHAYIIRKRKAKHQKAEEEKQREKAAANGVVHANGYIATDDVKKEQ